MASLGRARSARPLTRRLLAAAFVALGFVTPWGCGARSSIPDPHETPSPPPPPPPSHAFCGETSYPSGFGGLSIYVLLDQSASMADDNKWDDVTAAIAAFAEDPLVAGIGMGLQYFPLGDECSDAAYATPAVPIQLLPGNAAAIKASLAAHQPYGDTPTLPALRGAIEYARASLLAAPTRDVIVILATDGDPDTCASNADNVAAAAAQGLAGSPQVQTTVIGIQHANANALNEIATAGGGGMPIPIGSGTGAAQQFVNALRSIRDNEEGCRFAVPSPPGAGVTATDVGVAYQAPGAPKATLARIADAAGCAKQGGFYLDDPAHPTTAILCPGTCETAHMSPGSTVTVSAGCGAGSPPAGTPTGDAGTSCGGAITFECLTACDSTDPPVAPICVGTGWACPTGTVSTDECQNCEPVPHGCCMANGTLADGSCVNGAWTCPPGGTLFGQGSCQPPAVCAATLPCPLSDLCKVPDASCGLGTTPGSCQPIPSSCPPGGPQACGCDGQVYASACTAQVAGIDVSAAGNCATPPGTFPCGPLFCSLGSQICQRLAFDEPNAFACIAATPACSTGCEPGCANACPACPPNKKCFSSCTTSGGPLLTCNQI